MSIFFVSSFSLALVSTYFYFHDYTEIIGGARKMAEGLATRESKNLSELLREKISTVKTLSLSTNVEDELLKSNRIYSKIGKRNRSALIDKNNKIWMNDKFNTSECVDSVLTSKLSIFLKKYASNFPGEIGEIFITNKFGVVIASTSKLTTFKHSHKYWWKGAFNQGRGRTYIDDRGYDESASGYVLGFVTPIYVNNEIIGVLKNNINVISLLRNLVGHSNKYTKLKVVRTDGTVVLEKGALPLSSKVTSPIFDFLDDHLVHTIVSEMGKKKKVISIGTVDLSDKIDTVIFGGNQGERWHVLVDYDLRELFDEFDSHMIQLLLLSSALFLSILLISFFLARKVTCPILAISKAVREFRNHNYEVSFQNFQDDEIGMLARDVEKTARHLNDTTITIDRLKIARVEAEEAIKLKEKFVALVAHDLKSPLSTMSSIFEIMLDDQDDKLSTEKRKFIDLLQKSNVNMLHLIDDLLKSSRIKSGMIELSKKPIDASEMLHLAQESHSMMAGIKGIIITVDANSEIILNSDLSLVLEILGNLITNSIKFSQGGGQVTLRVVKSESECIISIQDNGVGVLEQYRKDLFVHEIKTTAPGTSGERGTGLGLPYCYDLAQTLGGSLSLESSESGKTIFSLTLPL